MNMKTGTKWSTGSGGGKRQQANAAAECACRHTGLTARPGAAAAEEAKERMGGAAPRPPKLGVDAGAAACSRRGMEGSVRHLTGPNLAKAAAAHTHMQQAQLQWLSNTIHSMGNPTHRGAGWGSSAAKRESGGCCRSGRGRAAGCCGRAGARKGELGSSRGYSCCGSRGCSPAK